MKQPRDTTIKLHQQNLNTLGNYGLDVDGIYGPATDAASLQEEKKAFPDDFKEVATDFPPDNDSALRAYYGPPGDSQLITFNLPYPMVLAWDQSVTVTRTSAHKKVVPSLTAILQEMLDEKGMDWIVANRMNLFGGIYNYRQMRGGSSWSRHAWGIAIDLDPDHNGLNTPWDANKIGAPGYATMPLYVVELFEKYGWKSYARSWGKDAMHFQGTQ